jgi:hypothetical protein
MYMYIYIYMYTYIYIYMYRVIAAMGISFVTAQDLLNRYQDDIRRLDGVTYDVFKTMVKDLANQFKKQEGRYEHFLWIYI